MTRFPRLLRALIGVFALTLLAAACGDSTNNQADPAAASDQTTQSTVTTTPEGTIVNTAAESSSDGQMADGEMTDGEMASGHHHDHMSPYEVPEGTPVPTLAVEVLPDPMAGYNLRLDTTNFTFAPEHVSTEPVPGEGHAHLYIDGKKITRVYQPWFNMPPLSPGSHEVRVELSANNHSPYAVNGELIDQTVTVEVPDTEPPQHMHHAPIEVPSGVAVPTLRAELVPDPAGGHNLKLDTTNFTFAPEHVSTEPVPGEGHAHLYIDGKKITRLYGPWYNLPRLDPGTHEIRVELSNNNHSPVAHDGQIIEDTVTLDVPGDAEPATTEPVNTDVEIAIEYAGGEVVGGVSRHTIHLGDTVRLTLTSDVADEAHLHVYDEMVDLEPGVPTDLVFKADIPGVVEIELEGLGKPLAEFEIR